MKPEVIFKYALYGTGIYALYKVGTMVGIFQTPQEIQEEQQLQTTLSSNYWLPKFYKDYLSRYSKVIILTPEAKKRLSDKLWDAKGWYNDDEDAVYAVFREMNYQTSLSSLADYFLSYKGKDLLTWLKDFLSEDELKNISSIISKYKVGYSTDGGKTYK
jgi:hypothetical protein